MKKILVITSKYLPNPSANGINAKYIIDELKRRSYDVTSISLKSDEESDFEIIDETKIHRITPSSYAKVLESQMNSKRGKASYYLLRRILRKLKLAIFLPIFPNFDPKQSQKVLSKLEELHNLNNFDCVIGIFKPYSNIAALKKFKDKYPDVTCIGYYLDLLNSMQKPRIMPRIIYDRLLRRENELTSKIFDASLVAISGKELYSKIEDKILLQNVHFVDFPTFLQRDKMRVNNNHKDKAKIIMTYAGTLDIDYRNPEMLLKVLNTASNNLGKISLNVYGNNNCKALFEKYYDNPKFQINNNGLASHDVVLKKMQESDILINVSNRIQDAVPSKIFELFSLGKPIINLVFDKKDITTYYFSKYPMVFNVEAWLSLESQIHKIESFISNNIGVIFEPEDIKKNYIMNTPEYTVDYIEKTMNSNSEVFK